MLHLFYTISSWPTLHPTPDQVQLLKSYMQEGGAFIYVCTNHQSGRWPVKAINSQRLGVWGWASLG
jgi:hypothetical protein